MSKTFQEVLEDARYEVNVDLYPEGFHYQIYKPDCPEAHCWEVYRNPTSDDEYEVDTGCDSLDVAIKAMAHDIDKQTMGDEAYRKYTDAVDLVCLNCCCLFEQDCEKCMVRISMDKIKTRREWRKHEH